MATSWRVRLLTLGLLFGLLQSAWAQSQATIAKNRRWHVF